MSSVFTCACVVYEYALNRLNGRSNKCTRCVIPNAIDLLVFRSERHICQKPKMTNTNSASGMVVEALCVIVVLLFCHCFYLYSAVFTRLFWSIIIYFWFFGCCLNTIRERRRRRDDGETRAKQASKIQSVTHKVSFKWQFKCSLIS